MCGIAGVVGDGASDAPLRAMADAMTARGPDGRGEWRGPTAGLAFRRLAIIDLHERSNQPMQLGPLHLVFNGEIYNYVELRAELEKHGHAFATRSDTEVLLHAWAEWGEQALDRLNGMFSFAVWDEIAGVLTLARDRFGEKPLLYVHDGARLAFASDVRALAPLAGLGGPRPAALEAFLALDLHPAPGETFFDRVAQMPPGHVARFEDGRLRLRSYWAPSRVDVPERYEEAVAEVRRLLLESVRLRLRADVPVGTSLSGGLDSSSIVALSAELAGDHRRHAFTATFPGYERDEWRFAREVAEAAGVVEHHAVTPTFEEAVADIDALVRDQGEPFSSLSIYAQWRVMRAAAEAGVTVLLDGQGADELFGGYAGIPGWSLRSMTPLARMRALAGDREWSRDLARATLAPRLPESVLFAIRRRLASPYVRRPAIERALECSSIPRPAWLQPDDSPLREELLRQTQRVTLPQLLRYADRDSMGHSREVRLPFLDPNVAEFALSLPASFTLRGGQQKRILRDAVRDRVPASVLDRREKVAFEPPQARWLGSPEGRDWVGGLLLDPLTRDRGLLDPGAIRADLQAGRWRDPHALWRAVSGELWCRAFVDRSPDLPARDPVLDEPPERVG